MLHFQLLPNRPLSDLADPTATNRLNAEGNVAWAREVVLLLTTKPFAISRRDAKPWDGS